MVAIREEYWISILRQLVKVVRFACWGCKRFRVLFVIVLFFGSLFIDRIVIYGGVVFEVIGIDFVGLILYKLIYKREGKVYLVIFSCSLSRVVYLELVFNLEISTFISCFKCLIVRRGRLIVIYFDNGSTFVKVVKWL